MAPRGFTNPAPKTESARSALSSFHCSLCNKSYSRHPEYEAHIGSYDHQHKKRLRDLKQLSKDPNAAERARRAERKADEKAGLLVVENNPAPASTGGSGGFKKGGFKSSFASVTGLSQPKAFKNVLGDDKAEHAAGAVPADSAVAPRGGSRGLPTSGQRERSEDNTDTDEEELASELRTEGGYYDPFKPTACPKPCPGSALAVSR
ncbi:hypothetical protein KEM56_005402 [Ascosphaera pollenicola]|nr:hypothetical protein KEM56_005402 [Ascosphaera pollenicola]